MRVVNPGFLEWFKVYTGKSTFASDDKNITNTGYFLSIKGSYVKYDFPTQVGEVWVSFDIVITNGGIRGYNMFQLALVTDDKYILLKAVNSEGVLDKKILYLKLFDKTGNNLLYDPQIILDASDGKKHNIEIHQKTGEKSRIDLWFDHKLKWSYRDPSVITGKIYRLYLESYGAYAPDIYLSSIIIQDTGRIGMERFVRLDTDKPTEQQFLAGTSTDFVLSNYPEGAEYEDITGVCVAFQGTSRDSAITEGKFTLDGADLGTIDVSDSSGRAWELTNAEVNSKTGGKWRREDIEGKTLSFLVGGD